MAGISAFLASLLAIGDPARDWAAWPEMREDLSDQLLVSRVFEIGLDGKVAALSGEGAPVRLAGEIAKGPSLGQPAMPNNGFLLFTRNSHSLLALGLAGMMLTILLSFSPLLRQILRVPLPRGQRGGALKLLPPES
ncbi:MAG: hypothetical protein J2P49_04990 [Methylocapsa sp.]|nr:hypothetical protein [Methylocapsa sp.]